MATTRHRSLVETVGRKAFVGDKGLAHTQKGKKNERKNRYSRILKNRFEHIELPIKLLDYVLRSNKSNINQIGSEHLAVFILIALPTHFHMHIQRHKHTSTHV